MLDQADFPSIDAYIRRHDLHDSSMAEQRRAKKLNINPTKEPNGHPAAGDGVGELEKAAREVQEMEEEEEEEEDEEEDENFDPGSEGESEGSGSSDEEEGEGEGNRDREGADLVGEELGSEAEDVDEDGEE